MSLFFVKFCIEKGVRNMALAAIKYRAYPTPEQAEFFQRTFGCVRKIWNCLLADSNEYHKLNKKHHVNYESQYKSVYPYLKDVDSLALSNARLQLQTAYNRFFEKKSGFPKFKSKHKSKRSYTTNNQGNTVALLDTGVKLPKVYRLFGTVKIKQHRKPADNWRIKSATVSMDRSNKYYISILFEYEDVSAVFFETQTDVTVGSAAKESAKMYPEQVVTFIKRSIGQPGFSLNLNGIDMKPEEISSYILKKVVKDAEDTLRMEGKRNPKQGYLVCDCGNRMQRDSNAAKNILSEGLRILTS